MSHDRDYYRCLTLARLLEEADMGITHEIAVALRDRLHALSDTPEAEANRDRDRALDELATANRIIARLRNELSKEKKHV